MFARYQMDRQIRELLDDYLDEKEIRLLFKKLEQKAVALQKGKKISYKTKRKEDQDGNNQED